MIPKLSDLDSNQHVRCFWGATDGKQTRFQGRIFAYSTGPMVHVENEKGERLWWAASLAERVDPPPPPIIKIRRILPEKWGVYCPAHPPIAPALGAFGESWDSVTPKTIAQSHEMALIAAEQHLRQFHAEVS